LARGKTDHGLLLASRIALITCRKEMDLGRWTRSKMYWCIFCQISSAVRVKRQLLTTRSRNPAPKRDFRSGIPKFLSLLRSAR